MKRKPVPTSNPIVWMQPGEQWLTGGRSLEALVKELDEKRRADAQWEIDHPFKARMRRFLRTFVYNLGFSVRW
jgi:hypothetical protein